MIDIDTIQEDHIAPLIYLHLRKTIVLMYPYAISLYMGTYSSNS